MEETMERINKIKEYAKRINKNWEPIHQWNIQYRKINKISVTKFIKLLGLEVTYYYEDLLGINGSKFNPAILRNGSLGNLLYKKLIDFKNNIETGGNIIFDQEPEDERILGLIKEYSSFLEKGLEIRESNVDNKNIIVKCSINLSIFDTKNNCYGQSQNQVIIDLNHQTLSKLIKRDLIKHDIIDESYHIIIMEPITNLYYL